MNEIEKLYKNVGIEPIVRDNAIGRGYYIEHQRVEEYPPFTADKQIELIKWLSKRRLLNVAFSNNKNTYQLFNNKCTGSFCSDLVTAIATLVQCELDFCTEEEKEQVKGILNE